MRAEVREEWGQAGSSEDGKRRDTAGERLLITLWGGEVG